MQFARLNMEFEVKDLVKTIDFYNILFSDQRAELYSGHAIYTLSDPSIAMRFTQNPATTHKNCGNFSLQLTSDDEVYERFSGFAASAFSNKLKVDQKIFSHHNHSFSIYDPNGICWKVATKEKEEQPFKLFNIPRMNSMWDILKAI